MSIFEQVANALNRGRVWSASLIGRTAVREGAVVVALDEGDRQDVFQGADAARVELGMTKDEYAATGRAVACVMPYPVHIHDAEKYDPAAGWNIPVMATPRAILAALDEARDRLRVAEERIVEQRSQLEAARLAEIDRDEEIRAIGAALDATGIPREDADGRGLTASQRARAAGICAGHGWQVGAARIDHVVGNLVRVTPPAPDAGHVGTLAKVREVLRRNSGLVGLTADIVAREVLEVLRPPSDPSAVAVFVADLREAAEGFEMSPPGQVPITLTRRANVPAILRRIKARLVDLAREAIAVGAPPSVLGHLHEARQRIEQSVLDIEGAPPLPPTMAPPLPARIYKHAGDAAASAARALVEKGMAAGLIVDDISPPPVLDAERRARAAGWCSENETGITAAKLSMQDGDLLEIKRAEPQFDQPMDEHEAGVQARSYRFADILHTPAIRDVVTESVMREMVSSHQTMRAILGVDKGSPEGSQTKLFLVRIDGGKLTGTAELETLAISDSRIRKLMRDRAALGDDRSVEAAEIALRREGTPAMSVDEARAYLVKASNKKPLKNRRSKNVKTDAADNKLIEPLIPAPGHVFVLRVCHPDMLSRNGFVWPGVGEEAKAPDWRPTKECGNGLHGWLWGVGHIGTCGDVHADPDAKWLIVEVEASSIVELDGKVKFPRGLVRFVGSPKDAAALIQAAAPVGSAIIHGTATAGDRGTATAGDRGTATAGDSGTATAGYRGTVLIKRWDPSARRYRWVIGEVGEGGIEANVPYILDASGKLVRKPQ